MSAIERRGVGKRAVADSYADDCRFRPSSGRKATPIARTVHVTRPAAETIQRPASSHRKTTTAPMQRMRPDIIVSQPRGSITAMQSFSMEAAVDESAKLTPPLQKTRRWALLNLFG